MVSTWGPTLTPYKTDSEFAKLYLSNRKIRVRIGNYTSELVDIVCGVTQESISGKSLSTMYKSMKKFGTFKWRFFLIFGAYCTQ